MQWKRQWWLYWLLPLEELIEEGHRVTLNASNDTFHPQVNEKGKKEQHFVCHIKLKNRKKGNDFQNKKKAVREGIEKQSHRGGNDRTYTLLMTKIMTAIQRTNN